MPYGTDFRTFARFSLNNVGASGLHVGRRVYWKLYVIENLYRIIIHSVLSVQIQPEWWPIAVDSKIQQKAKGFFDIYVKKQEHTLPGKHYIYYTDIRDLNEITRANLNLFIPIIPDMDEWIVRVEGIRLPRNVVAHMNFPNSEDQQRIDKLYVSFREFFDRITNQARIELDIPL